MTSQEIFPYDLHLLELTEGVRLEGSSIVFAGGRLRESCLARINPCPGTLFEVSLTTDSKERCGLSIDLLDENDRVISSILCHMEDSDSVVRRNFQLSPSGIFQGIRITARNTLSDVSVSSVSFRCSVVILRSEHRVRISEGDELIDVSVGELHAGEQAVFDPTTSTSSPLVHVYRSTMHEGNWMGPLKGSPHTPTVSTLGGTSEDLFYLLVGGEHRFVLVDGNRTVSIFGDADWQNYLEDRNPPTEN